MFAKKKVNLLTSNNSKLSLKISVFLRFSLEKSKISEHFDNDINFIFFNAIM